jgi:hypothetical protein
MNIRIPGVELAGPARNPVRAAPPRQQVPKFAPAKDEDPGRDPPSPVAAVQRGGSVHKVFIDVDSIPVGRGAGGSSNVSKQQPLDNMEDDDDRPIRPKATADYQDQDPDTDPNYGMDNKATNGESFEPGNHPLEGVVANFLELPTPEALLKNPRWVFFICALLLVLYS